MKIITTINSISLLVRVKVCNVLLSGFHYVRSLVPIKVKQLLILLRAVSKLDHPLSCSILTEPLFDLELGEYFINDMVAESEWSHLGRKGIHIQNKNRIILIELYDLCDQGLELLPN